MTDMLSNHSLIPIVEIESSAQALPLAEALLEGGLSIVEITLRTPAAVASIAAIAKHMPRMLVGAGTVLTAEDSAKARDAGASFGLAPGLNPAIVESFTAAGLAFVPGVITPSEIERAGELGCRLLKFFPAEAAGGVSYLKALRGPYAPRGIRFCATGGITLDNMAAYLACPLVSAVGGSWLASRERIAQADFATITANCRAALARIAEPT